MWNIIVVTNYWYKNEVRVPETKNSLKNIYTTLQHYPIHSFYQANERIGKQITAAGITSVKQFAKHVRVITKNTEILKRCYHKLPAA